MSKIRKSVYQSIGGKYATLIIDTAMLIIVSRLLTPSEIGIYSVCAVILGFAGIIRNSGLPEYIIQEKELTEARISTCFGAMLVVCWFFGIMLIIFSGDLASYYKEPAIKELILIMVIEFFLSPIGISTRALLRRNFEFGFLFKFNLTESIVKAVVTITLAFYNYSYYSLAIGALAGFMTSVLLLILFKRKYINFIPAFSELRHVLKFGLPSLGTSSSLYLDRYGPELIIASFLGFSPVALFNRAMSLRELFERLIFAGVSPIIMPAFSEINRNKGDMQEVYLKMQSLLLVIAWPFFGVLAMSALPLLNVLFGDQWDAAHDLVAILCLAGALWTATSLVPALIKSIGKVKELFKYQSLMTVFRLLGVVVAASFNITYVAWVFVFASALNSIIYWYLANKLVGLNGLEMIKQNIKNVVVAGFTMAPTYFVTNYAYFELKYIEQLVFIAIVSIVCWVLLVYVIKHPIRSEVNIAIEYVFETIMSYLKWRLIIRTLFLIVSMALVGFYYNEIEIAFSGFVDNARLMFVGLKIADTDKI